MQHILTITVNFLFISSAWASFIAKRHEDTCTKLCDDIHTINENTDKKIGEAETDIGNLRAECVCAFNKDVDARLEAIKREIAEMRAGCLCLTPKPVCDVGWSLFQGICYSYQSEKVNWDTAQERCLGLGGVLAAADTEDKSNFLIQLATDMGPGGGNPGPWLGGKLIGGQWVWTKTGDKLIYQNWGTGQPDHDYEKCLHIWTFTSGQWNNAPCTQLIPFICERPVSS